jgi:LAO/AO transport system kinase
MAKKSSVTILSKNIRLKKRRALAQGISLLEDGHPDSLKLLESLQSSRRKAVRVGVTGLPGSGKSTLIERIATSWIQKGHKVGIILVDPTSPISEGALLGDRIRLKKIQTHKNIFIRSMATRGRLGGLALASRYAADLMEAAGYDRILIETVGVGQLEVEVASAVHAVVVVTVPGMGDEIQILKAGLMEIADFFVVNKMDLDEDRIYYTLFEKTLTLTYESKFKRKNQMPSLYPVSTLTKDGVNAFLKSLESKLKTLSKKSSYRSLSREVILLMEQKIISEVLNLNEVEKGIARIKKKNGRANAFKIADTLLKKKLK